MNTVVAEFVADLLACAAVECAIQATAAVDRCRMPGELQVAFAGVSGAQVVEAFQAVGAQKCAGRADLLLEELHVALLGRQQVAAAFGRYRCSLLQGISNAGRGLGRQVQRKTETGLIAFS